MVPFHTGFGGTLDGVISIGVPAVAKGTGGSSPKSLTESLSPWVDKDGEPALNKEPPPPVDRPREPPPPRLVECLSAERLLGIDKQ